MADPRRFPRLRNNRKRVLAVVIAIVVVVAAAGITYFSIAHHGTERSIDAVTSDPTLDVTTTHGVTVISRAGNRSDTRDAENRSNVGFVFYPGGKVAPDAYLATLAPIVRRTNATVFVPHMPLNLAVLDSNAAAGIVDRHPEIDVWIIGGHSLGGVMACRYVESHPDQMDGLVLFASYCDHDVSDTGVDALSVTGGDDTVLDRTAYRKNRPNLPPNATFTRVDGMNHSEFGSYTGQRGDQPASLTYRQAHERLADVVVQWMQRRGLAKSAA